MVARQHLTQYETQHAPTAVDRTVAIRVCREVSSIASNEVLQWAFLDSIADRLCLSERTLQTAVRYAAQQGWLLLEGEPVHSVVLCDAATSILAGRLASEARLKSAE